MQCHCLVLGTVVGCPQSSCSGMFVCPHRNSRSESNLLSVFLLTLNISPFLSTRNVTHSLEKHKNSCYSKWKHKLEVGGYFMTGGNFLKRNVKTGISRQRIHVIFWCKKEKESSIIDSVVKSSSHLSKLSRKNYIWILSAVSTKHHKPNMLNRQVLVEQLNDQPFFEKAGVLQVGLKNSFSHPTVFISTSLVLLRWTSIDDFFHALKSICVLTVSSMISIIC